MAKVWYEVKKNKRLHAKEYDYASFVCGVSADLVNDKKFARKPRTGKFCKNCMRVINKKK